MKALIIGSTGMIGAELTRQLLEDNNYTEVVTFVRRASGVTHTKLTEQIVDIHLVLIEALILHT